MRKIFGAFLAAVFSLGLFACGDSPNHKVITIPDMNSIIAVQCGANPCAITYDAETNSIIYHYPDGSTVVVKQDE